MWPCLCTCPCTDLVMGFVPIFAEFPQGLNEFSVFFISPSSLVNTTLIILLLTILIATRFFETLVLGLSCALWAVNKVVTQVTRYLIGEGLCAIVRHVIVIRFGLVSPKVVLLLSIRNYFCWLTLPVSSSCFSGLQIANLLTSYGLSARNFMRIDHILVHVGMGVGMSI